MTIPRNKRRVWHLFKLLTGSAAVFLLLSRYRPYTDCDRAEGTLHEPLEWQWSKAKASLAYCIVRHLPDYEVERVADPMSGLDQRVIFRTKRDHKVLYSIEYGHEHIVFTRSKDVLYIADYSSISSGCDIVAIDLKTGMHVWESRLLGIGPVSHFQYLNLVNIETDGKRILVTGNELGGRYLELLDIRTGKMLSNKTLDPDPKLWESMYGD